MSDLFHFLPNLPSGIYNHLLTSLEKNEVNTSDLLTLSDLEVARHSHLPVLDVRRLDEAIISELLHEVGVGQDDNEKDDEKPARPNNEEPLVEKNENVSGALEDDKSKTTVSKDERREETVLAKSIPNWSQISTLDPMLDAALEGGIPTKYLTEFTGESASGKTLIILHLLLAVQLPPPHGLGRPALYISTESSLPIRRISELLIHNPVVSELNNSLPLAQRANLSNIYSIKVTDLESQSHILEFQVPVLVSQRNVGLIVVDSVAANFRADLGDDADAAVTQTNVGRMMAMSRRAADLIKLGTTLRGLAREHDCAVVVANQVADRFEDVDSMTNVGTEQRRTLSPSPPPSSSHSPQAQLQSSSQLQSQSQPHLPLTQNPCPMTLDYQQRYFSGWGDLPAPSRTAEAFPFSSTIFPQSQNLKTPALGLTWANQLSSRIALTKEAYQIPTLTTDPQSPLRQRQGWRRWFRVVFSEWCAPSVDQGIEVEIYKGGLRTSQQQQSPSRKQ